MVGRYSITRIDGLAGLKPGAGGDPTLKARPVTPGFSPGHATTQNPFRAGLQPGAGGDPTLKVRPVTPGFSPGHATTQNPFPAGLQPGAGGDPTLKVRPVTPGFSPGHATTQNPFPSRVSTRGRRRPHPQGPASHPGLQPGASGDATLKVRPVTPGFSPGHATTQNPFRAGLQPGEDLLIPTRHDYANLLPGL